jgi:hypothetical protein
MIAFVLRIIFEIYVFWKNEFFWVLRGGTERSQVHKAFLI